MLVVNHKLKVLYIVPVPLDEATIGMLFTIATSAVGQWTPLHESRIKFINIFTNISTGNATLCSPLVIKKNRSENTLICSILPNPGVDVDLMCTGSVLPSLSFAIAIGRATFVIDEPQPRVIQSTADLPINEYTFNSTSLAEVQLGTNVILATHSAILPNSQEVSQIIRFGKGLEWVIDDQIDTSTRSLSVFPCVLGGILEGPLLLATGEAPLRVPLQNMSDLHQYYKQAKSIVVIVDENMTDNARTLATTWRINGLFIVQKPGELQNDSQDVTSILDNLNINAITALAGPQSLILAQLGSKYYFYRGMANHQYIDPSEFKFGLDVTELISSGEISAEKLFHPSWPRLVDLSQDNPIYLPKSGQTLQLSQLENTFRVLTLSEIRTLKDDIVAMVPQ